MSTTAVAGGRDYRPTPADAWALRWTFRMLGTTRVLHGACRGVDQWAGRVAHRLGLPVVEHPADWSRGKRAGPERNARMLDEADSAIALPGGRGTADFIRRATERGLPLVRIGATSLRPKDEKRWTEAK